MKSSLVASQPHPLRFFFFAFGPETNGPALLPGAKVACGRLPNLDCRETPRTTSPQHRTRHPTVFINIDPTSFSHRRGLHSSPEIKTTSLPFTRLRPRDVSSRSFRTSTQSLGCQTDSVLSFQPAATLKVHNAATAASSRWSRQ